MGTTCPLSSFLPNWQRERPQDVERAVRGWRHIVVQMLDKEGNYHLDLEGNRINYEAIEDIATGDLYWDDDQGRVAIKCAALFTGIPLYTVFRMGTNATKIPLDFALIARKSLRVFRRDVGGEGFVRASVNSCKKFIEKSFKYVGRDLWQIVSSPFYALAIEFIAIRGLFNPYDKRKVIARLERKWQNGLLPSQDIRRQKDWENLSLKDKMHKVATYAAYCFQPYGNVHNPRYEVIERSPIPSCSARGSFSELFD